jgi:hypothetical protein
MSTQLTAVPVRGKCPGCGRVVGLFVIVKFWPQIMFVCGRVCYEQNFAEYFGPLEDPEPETPDQADDSTHLKVKTSFCAYPDARAEHFE